MTATLGRDPALSHNSSQSHSQAAASQNNSSQNTSSQTSSSQTFKQAVRHTTTVSIETSFVDQSLMLELIGQTDIVAADVLSQVAQLARMRNSQVIDVLFESGFIAASDRRAFMDANMAIRSNWLFKPWAVQALRQALTDFLPFNRVLEQLDLHPSNAFADSVLGELAVTAQLITREQFNQARQYSLARGLTVGQSLTRCCGLSIDMYKLLVDGMSRQAIGLISEDQLRQRVLNARYENTLTGAVTGSNQGVKLAQSTAGFGMFANNRDILEVLDLLVQSNCVSEITVLGLMEAALQNRMAFEAVWDECSPVPAAVLQQARAMHAMVASGRMSPQQAVASLREMKAGR